MTSSGKKMKFIFIADTSGSMYGEKISAVNATIAECVNEIRQIGDGNSGVHFYSFDEKLKVVGESGKASLVKAPSFLVEAGADGFYYMTSYACFYEGLSFLMEKLRQIIEKSGEKMTLCLFLLTDGKPSDSEEYIGPLERLKQESLYREAMRYVALAGQQGNTVEDPILKFVDNKMDKIILLSDLPGEIAKMKLRLSANNEGSDDRNSVYKSIFG